MESQTVEADAITKKFDPERKNKLQKGLKL